MQCKHTGLAYTAVALRTRRRAYGRILGLVFDRQQSVGRLAISLDVLPNSSTTSSIDRYAGDARPGSSRGKLRACRHLGNPTLTAAIREIMARKELT